MSRYYTDLTAGEIIEKLQDVPPDTKIHIEGKIFYRWKYRGENLLAMELTDLETHDYHLKNEVTPELEAAWKALREAAIERIENGDFSEAPYVAFSQKRLETRFNITPDVYEHIMALTYQDNYLAGDIRFDELVFRKL